MSRQILCDICEGEIAVTGIWRLSLCRISGKKFFSGEYIDDVVQRSIEQIHDLCNDCRVELGQRIIESRRLIKANVLGKREAASKLRESARIDMDRELRAAWDRGIHAE